MQLTIEGTYGEAKKWVKQLTDQNWTLKDYPEPDSDYRRSTYTLIRGEEERGVSGQNDIQRGHKVSDTDNEGFNGAWPV